MSVNSPRNFFSRPFASGGDKSIIPAVATVKGRASLESGFPLETQQPVEAGGVPPHRLDVKGTSKKVSE